MFGFWGSISSRQKKEVLKQLDRISGNRSAIDNTATLIADMAGVYAAFKSVKPPIDDRRFFSTYAHHCGEFRKQAVLQGATGFQDPSWSALYVVEGWLLAGLDDVKNGIQNGESALLETHLVSWSRKELGQDRFDSVFLEARRNALSSGDFERMRNG